MPSLKGDDSIITMFVADREAAARQSLGAVPLVESQLNEISVHPKYARKGICFRIPIYPEGFANYMRTRTAFTRSAIGNISNMHSRFGIVRTIAPFSRFVSIFASKVDLARDLRLPEMASGRLMPHGVRLRLGNEKMKIKSLVSIVARAESVKDRRLAIRNSWSVSETAERRQVAIDSQFQLASLIHMGQLKPNRIQEVLKLVAC